MIFKAALRIGVLTLLRLFLTIPGPLGSWDPATHPGHAGTSFPGQPSTCWQISLILSYLWSLLQPHSHQTMTLTTLAFPSSPRPFRLTLFCTYLGLSPGCDAAMMVIPGQGGVHEFPRQSLWGSRTYERVKAVLAIWSKSIGNDLAKQLAWLPTGKSALFIWSRSPTLEGSPWGKLGKLHLNLRQRASVINYLIINYLNISSTLLMSILFEVFINLIC